MHASFFSSKSKSLFQARDNREKTPKQWNSWARAESREGEEEKNANNSIIGKNIRSGKIVFKVLPRRFRQVGESYLRRKCRDRDLLHNLCFSNFLQLCVVLIVWSGLVIPFPGFGKNRKKRLAREARTFPLGQKKGQASFWLLVENEILIRFWICAKSERSPATKSSLTFWIVPCS